MPEIETKRAYRTVNGYGAGNKFEIIAATTNKKITKFEIGMDPAIRTDTMRLLAEEIKKMANTIDETENPTIPSTKEQG